MAASLIDIMELVCVNMTTKTRQSHSTPKSNHSPIEPSKAVLAPQRNSLTRSPVRSLRAPQAKGANSRVAACKEPSRLMATMPKPRCLSHKAR